MLDDLPPTRVLVTGAAGFIGAHLVRLLRARGADVLAPARGELDLADLVAVARYFADARVERVVHLASHVTGTRDASAVGPTFASNLASTVALLSAAQERGCARVVLAGSLEEPDADGVPSSPYAASKKAASDYARMFHKLYGTPVAVARLFMVYGPGQRDARKLVPYVARELLAGREPRLTSGVRPVDWVYVEDAAEALLRLLVAPGVEGRTVDVGTGTLTTVRSVAERVARLVGGRAPTFGAVEDRASERVVAADGRATRALLGRELVGLDEGLRRTVEWCRSSPV